MFKWVSWIIPWWFRWLHVVPWWGYLAVAAWATPHLAGEMRKDFHRHQLLAAAAQASPPEVRPVTALPVTPADGTLNEVLVVGDLVPELGVLERKAVGVAHRFVVLQSERPDVIAGLSIDRGWVSKLPANFPRTGRVEVVGFQIVSALHDDLLREALADAGREYVGVIHVIEPYFVDRTTAFRLERRSERINIGLLVAANLVLVGLGFWKLIRWIRRSPFLRMRRTRIRRLPRQDFDASPVISKKSRFRGAAE